MDDTPDVALWAIAISTHSGTGRQIIFRFAQEFSPSFDRSTLPDRIIIAWKYLSDTGQPTTAEHGGMIMMEDALEKVLEGARLATLALVSTGEGLREWTYYTRSEDAFIDQLNIALRGMPPFPIEIHTAHDPTWSMYTAFRAENPNM